MIQSVKNMHIHIHMYIGTYIYKCHMQACAYACTYQPVCIVFQWCIVSRAPAGHMTQHVWNFQNYPNLPSSMSAKRSNQSTYILSFFTILTCISPPPPSLPLPHFKFPSTPPGLPSPLHFQPQPCAILHTRGKWGGEGERGRVGKRGRDEDRGFISLSRPSVKCVHHASKQARTEWITHSSVTACTKLCPPFNRDEMGMQDKALIEIRKNNVWCWYIAA